MKQKNSAQDQNQKPVNPPRPTAAARMDSGETDFAPAADEVARRAYFAYENQGSLQGHEVQHWLTAEAELIAERQLTRTHGHRHHA